MQSTGSTSFFMGGAPQIGGPANQGMFVNGVPHNPPFVPNFSCPPSVQQFAGGIVGYTLFALQERANENPLRAYYFNLCAGTNWQTQDFIQLLTSVAELSEFNMAVGNMPAEAAVATAAREMVTIMVAISVQNNPQLQQLINNPGQVQSLNTALARFNEINQAITAMRQGAFHNGGRGGNNMNPAFGQTTRRGTSFGSMPAMGGGMGFGGGNVHMGGGNFGGGHGTGHSGGGPSIFNNLPNNNNSFTPNGYGNNQYGNHRRDMNKPAMVEESVTLTPNAKPIVQNSSKETKPRFPSAPNFNRGGQEYGRVSDIQQIDEQSQTSEIVDGVVFYPIDSDSEWPKTSNRLRPWDHMLWEDRTQTKPAHLSNWVVETTIERPYRVVYNPNTHVLMHVKRPDNTVLEIATPWKPEMDYLANELNPNLKRQARDLKEAASDEVVVPAWELTKALKPHPNLHSQLVPESFIPEEVLSEADKEVGDDVQAVSSIGHVITAHGLSEAETKASLAAQMANVGKDAIREYLYDEVDPCVGRTGDRRRISQLAECKTYQSFLSMLTGMKDEMDPDLFKEVDIRLTDAIVTTLTKAMSLDGWCIDSVFDCTELSELLRGTLTEAVADVFESSAPYNISTSLRTLSKEETASYMLDNFAVTESNNHVIFARRINVLSLPWKMDELSLNLGPVGGGVIGEDVLPDLYATAKRSFMRYENSEPAVAAYYLRTSDSKTLRFVRGSFNKSTYLVFQETLE